MKQQQCRSRHKSHEAWSASADGDLRTTSWHSQSFRPDAGGFLQESVLPILCNAFPQAFKADTGGLAIFACNFDLIKSSECFYA